MTLNTASQQSLINEGYEWATINVNGIEREGYVKWDYDWRHGDIEFIEHGSGDSFEPPIILKHDDFGDYYSKRY